MPPMSMKGQWGLLLRVLKMVMTHYTLHFIIVLLCVFAAMVCSTQSSLFTQDLFNTYIPGMKDGTLTSHDLFMRLVQLAVFLAVGVACNYASRIRRRERSSTM